MRNADLTRSDGLGHTAYGRARMNAANENGLPSGAGCPSDGEVVVPASRRADGSMRKPIRIRQGYVPQDEVPKYKTVGQRRREQEAKAGAGAAVDELSMDQLSLIEQTDAVVLNERPRSSDKSVDLEGRKCRQQLRNDKGRGTSTVEASSKSAGDDQQQLKRQLTRINKELKKIAILEDVEGGMLSRQKLGRKTELQQQRKALIAELNGATVTTWTSGPHSKLSIIM